MKIILRRIAIALLIIAPSIALASAVPDNTKSDCCPSCCDDCPYK